MNKFLSFSVIIPTLNCADEIAECLTSITNQSYKNFEIIIIDGESTDGTLKILNGYNQSNIRIVSEKDAGIYDAYNKGITLAQNDYLLFLGIDDRLYDNEVLKSIANVAMATKPDLIHTDIILNNRITHLKRRVSNRLSLQTLKEGYVPCHQSIFFHRSVFRNGNRYSLEFTVAPDYEFILKTLISYQASYMSIPTITTIYNDSGTAASIAFAQIVTEEHAKIQAKIMGESIASPEELAANNIRYRKWLESILIHKQGILKQLKSKGIGRIAILGTRQLALYLLADAKLERIEVSCFIDGDRSLKGQRLEGLQILTPEQANSLDIDAVIISSEGTPETKIKQNLKKHQIDCKIYSWKEFL